MLIFAEGTAHEAIEAEKTRQQAELEARRNGAE